MTDLKVTATKTGALAKSDTTVITVYCDITSDNDVTGFAATVRHYVRRWNVSVISLAYYGKLVIDVTQGKPSE